MSKYIIEIDDDLSFDVQFLQAIGAEPNGVVRIRHIEFEKLEELNSDYINEHFGDLQDDAYNKGYAQCQDDYSDALKHAKDTAYKKGLHDGESKCGYCNEYQRGLDDAWEAARKIVCDDELDWNTLLHIFNRGNFDGIFGDFSPSEAIAKLKAYEEKQKADGEIKVGDEVTHKSDSVVWKAVCIQIDGDGRHMNLMGHTGAVGYYPVDDFKKTGRHFDIPKILEEMRT